jgi:hypothetical protein
MPRIGADQSDFDGIDPWPETRFQGEVKAQPNHFEFYL